MAVAIGNVCSYSVKVLCSSWLVISSDNRAFSITLFETLELKKFILLI